MDFATALENLYAAFKSPVPRRIDGCPCCVDGKRVDRMHDVPLRDLTADDLNRYSFSVFTTVGSESDFRYFLPRILEITANDSGYINVEVILGKLWLAGWRSWPEADRRPVIDFIDAWFDITCHQPIEDEWDMPYELDSLICGIARTGLDVAHYLQRLLGCPDQLRAFHALNGRRLADENRLTNGFWADHEAQAATLIKFLNSAEVQAVLLAKPQ